MALDVCRTCWRAHESAWTCDEFGGVVSASPSTQAPEPAMLDPLPTLDQASGERPPGDPPSAPDRCPFCGRQVDALDAVNLAGRTAWRLRHGCPVTGRFLMAGFDRASIVQRWNRRAAPVAGIGGAPGGSTESASAIVAPEPPAP